MKKALMKLVPLILSAGTSAFAQQPIPDTEEALTKQTAVLKAQQAYYDQLTTTTKSQQAAADASVAAQTSSTNTATQLQNAQLANDLATATALRAAGLTATSGKEGTLSMAKAESSLLAVQAGSLRLVDELTDGVCKDLETRLTERAFIAPANYEVLVQKSVPEMVQLHALHSTAVAGIKEYQSVRMEFVGALAGALVSAQQLAGGIQALSKIFRTDYSITYATTTRQGAFEQVLSARCPQRIDSNIEGRLRLNASLILKDWIREMARFAELNDTWSESTAQERTQLASKRATAVADLAKAEAVKSETQKTEREKEIKEIDIGLGALKPREDKLARYKLSATAIKTYLSGLTTSTVYDSMVWGQDILFDLGGISEKVTQIKLANKPRLSYTLSVQDASVKASSTFFSEKLRTFSTAELVYSVIGSNGQIVAAAAISNTNAGDSVAIKDLAFTTVNTRYPKLPKCTPEGAPAEQALASKNQTCER